MGVSWGMRDCVGCVLVSVLVSGVELISGRV